MKEDVYLSLGSNMGNSSSIIKQAIEKLSYIPKTTLVKTSPLYETTPVGVITDQNFINAACLIQTTLLPHDLLDHLQDIEKELGKTPKEKHEPRPCDIDILFYEAQTIQTDTLTIPHPFWQERLFVLKPLLDLTDTLYIPSNNSIEILDLKEYVKNFKNPHNETVTLLEESCKT